VADAWSSSASATAAHLGPLGGDLDPWGGVVELAEVIALAERRQIDVHIERFALADAVDAYGKLERGEMEGRAGWCRAEMPLVVR
jgi:hypothetical protein